MILFGIIIEQSNGLLLKASKSRLKQVKAGGLDNTNKSRLFANPGLECPLASPVLAQSWSQTATDEAWYSTTELLSGRDRPRCLCVLRLSGSEPETRRTGAIATSLPSNSLPVARAGNVELDRYPQPMLPVAEIR